MRHHLLPFALKLFTTLMAFMHLFRWQFWWVNRAEISFEFLDFLRGMRFDLSVLGYTSLFFFPLFFGLSFIPSKSMVTRALWIASMALFALILLPELWDLVYFQYTLKRSSYEIYLLFLTGDDALQFQGLFERFWYILPLLLFWFAFFALILRKFLRTIPNPTKPITSQVGILLLCLSGAFLAARNSVGPKPLGIMDAAQFGDPARSQLILNAPFVLLKTLQISPLPNYHYLDHSTERRIFNPIRNYASDSSEFRPNIVVIIVESLGYQQLGRSVNGIPLTPFLDSLIRTKFPYQPTAISGGKTSIECLPALFAGIPSWMETPFILSNYGLNQLHAFPKMAYNKGYRTLFFHGATEGSMRFGATVKHLGFHDCFFQDQLVETNEAPGSWGYHDHTVLTNLQKELKKTTRPFLACLFTLSTHEPYDIPSSYRKSHPELNKEQASYHYLDDCLRRFFKEASRQQWYNNTFFVITGDHPPVHLDHAGLTIADYYQVPMLLFSSSGNSIACNDHLTVIPSLCNFLGWKESIYSFGHESDISIRYLNGLYHIWNDQVHLEFNEHLQEWNVRKNSSKDPDILNKLKQRFYARIQRYRNDLRSNTLHP